MPEPAKHPFRLFYCYARQDEAIRDTLDGHLSSLKQQNLIQIWYDRKISPGREWKTEIDNHLSSADIVLLLVSANFLKSDYCYGKEMAQALQRHEEGMVRIVPIILRPVDWEGAPFSKLQVLPTDAKPVTKWANRDNAYEDIAKGLRQIAKELQDAPKTSEEWFQKGELLKNLRRYADALPAYNRAIQLDPNNAVTSNNKGVVLNELERYEEAIRAFDQAIRLNPSNASVYSNKGFALNKLGRYGEAIHICDQAIQLNPGNASAHNNKGFALRNLERYEEAVQAYDQAVQFNPNYALAYSNKSIVLTDLERYEEAIVVCEQAIRLNPNDTLAYHNKGVALNELERYEEAIHVFDQVIQLDPSDSLAHYNRSIALAHYNKSPWRAIESDCPCEPPKARLHIPRYLQKMEEDDL